MFLGAAVTVSLIGSSASPTWFDELALTSHGEATAPAFVERVRQVTRPFRDIQHARSAGYAQFLGCVSGPVEGAMGIHYVNSKLVEDGELDASHPEALIYEQNGEPRLVGVEYIVPVDAWHARHKEPPVLDGQVLQYSGSPNRYGLPAFYELHVWAWRENPHGAFVDWNPRVSCEGQ
jgi:hypothetical protein